MNMRKLFSFMLALVMLLALIPGAFAQQDSDFVLFRGLPSLNGSGSFSVSGSGGSYSGNASSAPQNGGSLPTIGGSGSFSVSGSSAQPASTNTGFQPDSSASTGSVSRTFMIYIVGSDLESAYQAATADLSEMIYSGVDLNNTNVVLAMGGSNLWHSLEIGSGQGAFGALEMQGSEMGMRWLRQPAPLNMAQSSTLSDFLNEAYRNYPADEYCLILWDHGGGPLYGFGSDEYYEENLSLKEITDALRASPFSGKKLEFIGFDACLMSSVEVASMMSPYARYMVASEETTPGSGWDYRFLGSPQITGTSTTDMLRTICDGFSAYCVTQPANTITISALDLSRIAEVEQAFNELFDYPYGISIPQDLSTAVLNIQNTWGFARYSTSQDFDLFDLYGYAQQMTNVNYSAAQKLMNAIDSMVVCEVGNISGAHGVSFFFPAMSSYDPYQLCSLYGSFDFADNYVQFMDALFDAMSTRALDTGALSMSGFSRSMNAENIGSSSRFTLQLTEEQKASFARASYIIVTPSEGEEGMMDLVRGGFGVEMDENGLLCVDVDPYIHTVRDQASSESNRFTLIESDRTDASIRYHLPLMLTRGLDVNVVNAQLETTQANPAGEWGSMVPSTDNMMAPRQLLEFEPEDLVTLIQLRYTPTYDEAGNIRPFQEWTGSGSTVYASALTVQNGLTLDWIPAEGEYYVQINCTDVYGQRYCSDLIPLNAQ